MNRCYFVANVANDPVLRGEEGKSVLTFRIAVSERVFDFKTEDFIDTASFFDAVMFGNRARAIAEFLHKGARVTLECRARQNTWETDDGSKRSRVEFVIQDIIVHRDAS